MYPSDRLKTELSGCAETQPIEYYRKHKTYVKMYLLGGNIKIFCPFSGFNIKLLV